MAKETAALMINNDTEPPGGFQAAASDLHISWQYCIALRPPIRTSAIRLAVNLLQVAIHQLQAGPVL